MFMPGTLTRFVIEGREKCETKIPARFEETDRARHPVTTPA